MEVFYIHLMVRWCIAAVGIVANLLGLVVLLQPVFRKKSTFVYLSALAITDTAVLVCLPINMSIWNVKPPLMATALVVYFQQCSSCLLAAVTVDRCIIVFYPLRSLDLCTRKRSLLVMLVLYIVVPLPQLLGLICVHNKDKIPEKCYKIQAHIYVGMYALLPFFILIIANISIILRLRMRKRELKDMTNANSAAEGEREMSGAEKDDRKINIMLIFTTVAFFLLVTPVSLARVINILPYDKLYENYTLEILVDIGLVNHAINMFIYCSTGRKFREEAIKVMARMTNYLGCRFVCLNNASRRPSDILVSRQTNKHGIDNQASPLQSSDISYTPGGTDSSKHSSSSM